MTSQYTNIHEGDEAKAFTSRLENGKRLSIVDNSGGHVMLSSDEAVQMALAILNHFDTKDPNNGA